MDYEKMEKFLRVAGVLYATDMVMFFDDGKRVMVHITSEKAYEIDIEKMREQPTDKMGLSVGALNRCEIMLNDKNYLASSEELYEFFEWIKEFKKE